MRALTRFLIFLVVLAVALGGLYLWWQRHAVRVITGEVHRLSRSLVVNPERLKVQVMQPVKMVGLREATVPHLVISGHDLVLRDGPEIKEARLEIYDMLVSGPPFHYTGVGKGSYRIVVTDDAATRYLRTRGVKLPAVARIPLDSLTIAFSRAHGMRLRGEYMLPVTNTRIPLRVDGKLMPSSTNGEVDFSIRHVEVGKLNLGSLRVVTKSLSLINPIITVAEWPFLGDIDAIASSDGQVVVRGVMRGVRPSFLQGKDGP